ncbi:MAG TPA: DNA polymerase III subunit delta [Candidatus Saccharimonadales bacterium]|nr:DNA polymerase III subunit delta [Candidatus Saccharimonadales bacterium]
MPAAAVTSTAPLILLQGDDEFAVKQRARQMFQKWSEETGGMDHEIIDGQVTNSGEALKALGRLREALQTMPFFGGAKVIWLQNCNFLGDERAAGASAVTETLAEIAQELKAFSWQGVRLLISAAKVDKRKTFYKTLEKLGTVETFTAWSMDDKDWVHEAESATEKLLQARKKTCSDETLKTLVLSVGPNSRQLMSEMEKLTLYVGERSEITLEDVKAIVTRNKQARAFALGDALGDRNLPELLRRLDEELWEMNFDSQKSEIGLLYGLISKVRAMLFLKEMVREGWITAEGERDYNRFKGQLARVPADQFPEDKRFNPMAINSFVLFKAAPQARRYSTEELVRGMELLLECNQRLIFSSLDESLVLQQTLVQIVRGQSESQAASKNTKACS